MAVPCWTSGLHLWTAFPNTLFFCLCDATLQKVVDGGHCLISHFEDEWMDYYLLYQFYHKLLQFFFCTFIVIFWANFYFFQSLFGPNFFNRKFNKFIQINKDNNTGNHMKKEFWLYHYYYCFINFPVLPLGGLGGEWGANFECFLTFLPMWRVFPKTGKALSRGEIFSSIFKYLSNAFANPLIRTYEDKLIETSLTFLSFTDLWLLKIMGNFLVTAEIQTLINVLVFIKENSFIYHIVANEQLLLLLFIHFAATRSNISY